MNENNLPKEKIDEIIMIGGVCRIPKIQEIIKNVFGKEPNKSVNPEEAPAIGGAIMVNLFYFSKKFHILKNFLD